MKLTTLKPRLQSVKTGAALPLLSSNPIATPRQRGRKWMAIRERWMAEHPLCVECKKIGRTSLATILDHVVPLIDGGRDDESNYQSLCVDHHDAKTAAEATARGRSERTW